MNIKVLSLTEPWASLVAIGAKLIETRSWSTRYRGPLAIHAAKTLPAWALDELDDPLFHGPLLDAGILELHMLGWPPARLRRQFPLGQIIAVGELTECFRFTPESIADIGEPERSYGNYDLGRYGFRLANVRRLKEPISARGALGLWAFDLPEEVSYVV